MLFQGCSGKCIIDRMKGAGCPQSIIEKVMACESVGEAVRVLSVYRACLLDGAGATRRQVERLDCLISTLGREYDLN